MAIFGSNSNSKLFILPNSKISIPVFGLEAGAGGGLLGILFGFTFAFRHFFFAEKNADGEMFVVVGASFFQALIGRSSAGNFLGFFLETTLGIQPKTFFDDLW